MREWTLLGQKQQKDPQGGLLQTGLPSALLLKTLCLAASHGMNISLPMHAAISLAGTIHYEIWKYCQSTSGVQAYYRISECPMSEQGTLC